VNSSDLILSNSASRRYHPNYTISFSSSSSSSCTILLLIGAEMLNCGSFGTAAAGNVEML